MPSTLMPRQCPNPRCIHAPGSQSESIRSIVHSSIPCIRRPKLKRLNHCHRSQGEADPSSKTLWAMNSTHRHNSSPTRSEEKEKRKYNTTSEAEIPDADGMPVVTRLFSAGQQMEARTSFARTIYRFGDAGWECVQARPSSSSFAMLNNAIYNSRNLNQGSQ